MSIGLIGKKLGMTRIFTDEGEAIAVTVIDVSDNVFIQKKTADKDGYTAVQVGFDHQKDARVNKPLRGQFKSNGVAVKRVIKEFRLAEDEELPEIDHPGLSLFEAGQWVDVIGTSKGKGFQGVVKRYNYGGLPQTHGSMMHRRTGSIAPGSTPGRVWKNKQMPGRHGNYRKTIQNLKVVQTREEDQVILISGAVPGAKGGYVIIRPSIKKEKPVQKLKKSDAPAPAEAAPQEEAGE